MIQSYNIYRGITKKRAWLASLGLILLAVTVLIMSSLTPLLPTSANVSQEQWEIDGFVQVDVGQNHSCGLTTNNEVYCWGSGNLGQIGIGESIVARPNPTKIDSSGVLAGKTITNISVGGYHSCVVASGKAYCWGNNEYGQLGNNSTTNSLSPTAVNMAGVLSGTTITAVTAGERSTCAIADGKAYCWGSNDSQFQTDRAGQLGNGTTVDSLVPVAVDASGVLAGKTVTSLAAGDSTTCAIADGKAYCWGFNLFGQLGNNSTTNSLVPVAVDTSGVLAGKTITSLTSGGTATCAAAGGKAYCWGKNTQGQLGNGTTDDSLVPATVDTLGVLAGKTVTSIALGYNYSCAVATDKPYCWGLNQQGQLGNGTTGDSLVPVAVDASGVLAGKTVTSIGSGYSSVCTIAGVEIFCWGNNNTYQLGNGTTVDSSAPSALQPQGTSTASITGVTFVTINNLRYLNVEGSNLLPVDNNTVPGLLNRSLVTLNGDALGVCTAPIGANAATLGGLTGRPDLLSDDPPCYNYLDSGNAFLITDTDYFIQLEPGFDESAPGTVQTDGAAEFAFNTDSEDPDPGNGDHEDPTFIVNLPSNLTATTNTGTNLENTGTTSDHSVVQLKTTEGFILAEIPVNTSVDRDWSSVTAGIDPVTKKAFVHGLATAPGSESSTFTLFVPKALNDTAVIICPGAASLIEVRKDCPNAITHTAASSNVSIVTVDGKQYWKVAGLTGTGGMSVLGAAIGAPNTGVAGMFDLTSAQASLLLPTILIAMIATLGLVIRKSRYNK